MKYSIAVKFVAILLCALSLAAILGSAFGIIGAEEFGLYSDNPDAWRENELYSVARDLAYHSAQLYAAEHLGGCSEDVLDALRENDVYDSNGIAVSDDIWSASISRNGEILVPADASLAGADMMLFEVEPYYPVVSPDAEKTFAQEEAALDAAASQAEWSEYVVVRESSSKMRTVRLDFYAGPTYDVALYLQTDRVATRFDALASLLFNWRYSFIASLLTGLLLFAASLVYLCWAAGRKAGTQEIVPAGLNQLPLDLYALCAAGGCLLLSLPVVNIIEYLSYSGTGASLWLCISAGVLCVFGAALLVTGFLFAFSAQVKIKNGYWWRHSICGWCLQKVSQLFRLIGRGLCYVGRGFRAVFRLLPIIWQWLLTAAGMALVLLILLLLTFSSSYLRTNVFFFMLLFIAVFACIAIVCYGGYCFGTLMKGAKAMAQGNLNRQIPTRYLLGSFRDFAIQLNSLAGAAQLAAERQMKSERMKTELITNVSHDIKTPLTSIINYVDLLKKPHSESDGALYLEVLDRQSLRLKKLIDDLMEMSKASTGNLTVEIARVDATEAINQALGEFSDKLESVNLTPVFRHPESPVTMLADGRLVWRVLSNLLSNAYKYALPDTRLYIDLMVLQGNAVIAIKNISRDQLNVNADELMERFVRGDSSRNTEGSGLGLNIAKSLVELQHGQMHLMVDGDLFKVTLIFPCA